MWPVLFIKLNIYTCASLLSTCGACTHTSDTCQQSLLYTCSYVEEFFGWGNSSYLHVIGNSWWWTVARPSPCSAPPLMKRKIETEIYGKVLALKRKCSQSTYIDFALYMLYINVGAMRFSNWYEMCVIWNKIACPCGNTTKRFFFMCIIIYSYTVHAHLHSEHVPVPA